MSEGKNLTLYSRVDCSLCKKLQGHLEQFQHHHPFQLAVVDIDSDLAIQQKYNYLVPILIGDDGEEVNRYHFDPVAISEYLQT